ncbi:MAG: LysR family transcriptional regulator [Lachnospiraceae bacterium]|nr:LysR family transcriptional regulator [Lachnospiraceae bacterium]MDD3616732.1 LysR family transcriptional regulator [Lachnospiraceae bacterium]
MDTKDLEYFRIVCEQKSITKAAHYLYMTQQGLSKIIKNIEKELNTTLLERNTTGITLTQTGEYLYSQIPEFLENYQTICNEIICIEQSQNHEIELLSSYGIIRLVTPECLVDFRKKYPQIRLVCHEYPDREVERRWSQGQGNAAFLVGNNLVGFPKAKEMEKFEIKLLVNKKHPLADRKGIRIQDLKGERMYLESSEFNIHELVIKKCQEAGFKPDIVFETSGFSLCHKMVQQNKGISVTVDFIFEDMTDSELVMIPFEEEPLYWITYMMTREGSVPNADVILFGKHVLKWQENIQKNHILR